jgi:hypothetical protein
MDDTSITSLIPDVSVLRLASALGGKLCDCRFGYAFPPSDNATPFSLSFGAPVTAQFVIEF